MCYAHQDAEAVDHLISTYHGNGLETFDYRKDMIAGEVWKIPRIIDSSGNFLPVIALHLTRFD